MFVHNARDVQQGHRYRVALQLGFNRAGGGNHMYPLSGSLQAEGTAQGDLGNSAVIKGCVG